MDDQTAERIHTRIDEMHTLINQVNFSYAKQTEKIDNLCNDVTDFIKKVDNIILHPQEGCISKSKAKLSSICTQLKNQWYLISLLLIGLIGIAWETLKKP